MDTNNFFADELTQKEKDLLSLYFTNLDKPVFCLINLPEVVKGALFSRYSRTTKSLRRVLLDEFINASETGFKDIAGKPTNQTASAVAVQKAEEFYDRVLVGYGDDSVAELAGAHLAVEGVSQIGVKLMEDSRIGLSPLEKSTRYVKMDDKINGYYRYYRPKEIYQNGFGKLYENYLNSVFQNYSELYDIQEAWFLKNFPKDEEATDRAYKATIKAKTCDTLRLLLPAATLTNVGFFGNGRSFEYMLIKMLASPYSELHALAPSLKEELDKVIPSFVKRSTNERGVITREYIRETRTQMTKLLKEAKILKLNFDKKKGCARKNNSLLKLIDYDSDAEEKVLASMLFPYCHNSLIILRKKIRKMKTLDKEQIIKEYCFRRTNRHHKLGRALENTYYTFEIVSNFGAFKDLQRHRMLTQERQLFTPFLGYDTPPDLIEAKTDKKYKVIMDKAFVVWEKINKKLPFEAQYVLPMGYRMRYYFKMNLREVSHLTELRSQRQGHPNYRIIAQEIAKLVKKAHPLLAFYATQFVDMNDYKLERLEAEKRLDKNNA